VLASLLRDEWRTDREGVQAQALRLSQRHLLRNQFAAASTVLCTHQDILDHLDVDRAERHLSERPDYPICCRKCRFLSAPAAVACHQASSVERRHSLLAAHCSFLGSLRWDLAALHNLFERPHAMSAAHHNLFESLLARSAAHCSLLSSRLSSLVADSQVAWLKGASPRTSEELACPRIASHVRRMLAKRVPAGCTYRTTGCYQELSAVTFLHAPSAAKNSRP